MPIPLSFTENGHPSSCRAAATVTLGGLSPQYLIAFPSRQVVVAIAALLFAMAA